MRAWAPRWQRSLANSNCQMTPINMWAHLHLSPNEFSQQPADERIEIDLTRWLFPSEIFHYAVLCLQQKIWISMTHTINDIRHYIVWALNTNNSMVPNSGPSLPTPVVFHQFAYCIVCLSHSAFERAVDAKWNLTWNARSVKWVC